VTAVDPTQVVDLLAKFSGNDPFPNRTISAGANCARHPALSFGGDHHERSAYGRSGDEASRGSDQCRYSFPRHPALPATYSRSRRPRQHEMADAHLFTSNQREDCAHTLRESAQTGPGNTIPGPDCTQPATNRGRDFREPQKITTVHLKFWAHPGNVGLEPKYRPQPTEASHHDLRSRCDE
jgi:hypothetical protein